MNEEIESINEEDLGSLMEDVGEPLSVSDTDSGTFNKVFKKSAEEIKESQIPSDSKLENQEKEIHKKSNAGIKASQFKQFYQSTASVKDQLDKYPDSVLLDKIENKVFDLSKSTDVQEMNAIYTKSVDADNGINIVEELKQYSTHIDNWKVFMKIAYYKFKKMINHE